MKDFFDKTIRILDGAAGTYLIARGMPSGGCPEAWAAEHLPIVEEMHRAYSKAGADTVFAFTFGANPLKLAEYRLEGRTEEINRVLVGAARAAAGGRPVGGDMATTGHLMAPIGDLTFEKAFACYARQARALAEAGVDYLIIETMLDVSEARAAVLAARSVCDLPVWVSMTYDEDGYTLTGADAETAAITLAACGAAAIGVNCGIGPAGMEEVVRRLATVSPVPVFAKPNAGLPSGATLSPQEFARQTARLVQAGASAVGGCCGTEPESIRLLRGQCARETQHIQYSPPLRALTGSGGYVRLGEAFCPIGERINPTGKKKLQTALRKRDLETPLAMAREQIEAGAKVLDVNVGMSGVDETELLPELVTYLSQRVAVPLCIDTAKPEALAAALRVYPGRALINSISAEPGRAEAVFPLMRQYGAMAILLPVDANGVPETAEQRIEIVRRLIEQAEGYGLGPERFVVDAVAMTVAGSPNAAREALGVVDWCQENGLLCTMGLSNVSFGLPERSVVNAAFLSSARARGLQTAIVNVCDPVLYAANAATNALLEGRAEEYAALYTRAPEQEGLAGAVMAGNRSRAGALVQASLDAGESAQTLVDQTVAGLDGIGAAFAAKKAFLPQLMAAADTAQTVFAMVEPFLGEKTSETRGTVVIATVKGDIHDIGKNLVALMLRNHGFRVIDLGRDVPNERIVQTAIQENADLVALSALLTTTMEQMRGYMQMNRACAHPLPVMIGGAAVSRAFAEEIGAQYSIDAAEAVVLAKQLTAQ